MSEVVRGATASSSWALTGVIVEEGSVTHAGACARAAGSTPATAPAAVPLVPRPPPSPPHAAAPPSRPAARALRARIRERIHTPDEHASRTAPHAADRIHGLRPPPAPSHRPAPQPPPPAASLAPFAPAPAPSPAPAHAPSPAPERSSSGPADVPWTQHALEVVRAAKQKPSGFQIVAWSGSKGWRAGSMPGQRRPSGSSRQTVITSLSFQSPPRPVSMRPSEDHSAVAQKSSVQPPQRQPHTYLPQHRPPPSPSASVMADSKGAKAKSGTSQKRIISPASQRSSSTTSQRSLKKHSGRQSPKGQRLKTDTSTHQGATALAAALKVVSKAAPQPADMGATSSASGANTGDPRGSAWARVRSSTLNSADASRSNSPKSKVQLIARSGILSRPALRNKGPSWWKMPQQAVIAANLFDQKHYAMTGRAERMLRLLGTQHVSLWDHVSYQKVVHDVGCNRFFIPEFAAAAPIIYEKSEMDPERYAALQEAQALAAQWRVDKSVWTPRKTWAESRDYHDTDELIKSCIELDWELSLTNHNTKNFISKIDSSPQCLHACFDVLWENAEIVYRIFDYYATLGATDDICHMGLNAYKTIVDDCKLVVPGSKVCNLTAFDTLFIQVNAGSENPRSMGRFEWIECLVRVAALRFITTGEMESFPEALRRLITLVLVPKVDRRALQDTRAFRDANCYTQDVDEILSSYLGSLRSIFKAYARGEGAIGNEMDDIKLLSYVEWKELVKDLKLIDDDFTAREQDLAFIWSRMRVVDDRLMNSKKKLHQLEFEDFLEVIVRCSTFKTLPSDEQIFDFGFEDAGEFLLVLKNDSPAKYAEWLRESSREWDDPLPQPIFRLIEHMCTFIMRTIMAVVKVDDMEALSVEEAKLFQTKARERRENPNQKNA